MLVQKIREWVVARKFQFEVINTQVEDGIGGAVLKLLHSGQQIVTNYKYPMVSVFKNNFVEFINQSNDGIHLNYYTYNEDGYLIDCGVIEAKRISFINFKARINGFE